MAGRIITVDLAIDQSSIYKVIDMPTSQLLVNTVEEFEKENPLYHLYNFKNLGQLQETYTSSVGSDRIKKQTAEMAVAEIGRGGQEGFSGTKTYRMYSGSYQITKRAVLEATQSGNFNAIAYNTADRTKTWLRNNVEDGVRAILGAFGTAVKGDDGTPYRFITTDTVDGRSGQYAINSARNNLFSTKHTLVRKSELDDAVATATLSPWFMADGTQAPYQSNVYIAQNEGTSFTHTVTISAVGAGYTAGAATINGATATIVLAAGAAGVAGEIASATITSGTVNLSTGSPVAIIQAGGSGGFANINSVSDGTYGINLMGSDPGKIAKLADLINVIITNMENQLDDNGKPAGMHGPKEIVGPNDARLVAALNSALNEPMHKGFGDQSIPNPAYKRISKCNFSVYWNTLQCLYNKATQSAVGFFIVDKSYMAANNGLEITQRFPLEVTSEEHKNPAFLDVIFSEGMEFNCLTWRGITYVCLSPSSQTNMFSIPASISGTGAIVDIAITSATPVIVIDTMVKPVSVVGTVNTSVVGTVTTKAETET